MIPISCSFLPNDYNSKKCNIFNLYASFMSYMYFGFSVSSRNSNFFSGLFNIQVSFLYLQEDFQPMSYGFKMAGDVSEPRAIGMIKEVEEEYGKLSKVSFTSI